MNRARRAGIIIIHKHIGAYKAHQFSKVSVKHATSPKRS